MNTPTRHHRRGANAIEFALTLPVFITIIFGLIDYGGYFASQAMVDSIITKGCRMGAMTDPLDIDVPAETRAMMTDLVDKMPLINCGAFGDGCLIEAYEEGNVPGRSLICSLRVHYQGLTGFTPWLPPTVASATMMRYEWQRPELGAGE